jgi:hypothetical protein
LHKCLCRSRRVGNIRTGDRFPTGSRGTGEDTATRLVGRAGLRGGAGADRLALRALAFETTGRRGERRRRVICDRRRRAASFASAPRACVRDDCQSRVADRRRRGGQSRPSSSGDGGWTRRRAGQRPRCRRRGASRVRSRATSIGRCHQLGGYRGPGAATRYGVAGRGRRRRPHGGEALWRQDLRARSILLRAARMRPLRLARGGSALPRRLPVDGPWVPSARRRRRSAGRERSEGFRK